MVLRNNRAKACVVVYQIFLILLNLIWIEVVSSLIVKKPDQVLDVDSLILTKPINEADLPDITHVLDSKEDTLGALCHKTIQTHEKDELDYAPAYGKIKVIIPPRPHLDPTPFRRASQVESSHFGPGIDNIYLGLPANSLKKVLYNFCSPIIKILRKFSRPFSLTKDN